MKYSGSRQCFKPPLLLAAGALLCATLSPTPESVRAQTVLGHLYDSETRGPVINGAVALRNDLGTVVARSATDAEGAYELTARAPGTYSLLAAGLGYRSTPTGQFELVVDETLTIDISLSPEPLELTPLVVSAERIRTELQRQGFFRRKERGYGFFLTPEELTRRPPITEAEVIARVPFVFLDRERRWDGTIPTMHSFGQDCVPAVLVDDAQVPVGRPSGTNPLEPPPSLEEFVNFADITALEVYRGLGEIPHELTLPFESCGVIMIWTVWSEQRSKKRGGG